MLQKRPLFVLVCFVFPDWRAGLLHGHQPTAPSASLWGQWWDPRLRFR